MRCIRDDELRQGAEVKFGLVFGISDPKILCELTQSHLVNLPLFCCCRYVAICHPLSTHARHSKSLRAFGVLAALWLFGVCFSLPWIIPTKVRNGR